MKWSRGRRKYSGKTFMDEDVTVEVGENEFGKTILTVVSGDGTRFQIGPKGASGRESTLAAETAPAASRKAVAQMKGARVLPAPSGPPEPPVAEKLSPNLREKRSAQQPRRWGRPADRKQ